jgi:bacterioferritin-associated ferredoxin
MYICLCNGYRESELRDMARQGYTDAEEAYEALGDGPCCGRCVDFAQDIMDEERASPCVDRRVAEGSAPAGIVLDLADTTESRPAEDVPGAIVTDAAV